MRFRLTVYFDAETVKDAKVIADDRLYGFPVQKEAELRVHGKWGFRFVKQWNKEERRPIEQNTDTEK